MSKGKGPRNLHSIDFDQADRMATTFSVKREVPSLVMPAGAVAVATPPVQQQREEVRKGSVQEVDVSAVVAPVEGARARVARKLTVVVPEYVVDLLADKAREKRCTVRYLVLQGLKDSKFEIEEADLRLDGRRTARA